MYASDVLHPVTTQKSQIAFENAIVRVENNVIRNSSTLHEGMAVRISSADAGLHLSIIIPVMTDGRLVVVGRFRYATGNWSLEFPRVCCHEEDLTWKELAEQQLLRDAGLAAEKLTLLGAAQVDPALTSLATAIVLAEGCRETTRLFANPPALIAGKAAMTPDELGHLIRRGEITCGLTLAALCMHRAQTERDDA